MIDKRTRLYVFHDDNSIFVDHTHLAADLSRDDFNVELISAEDYLYLGFIKPFNAAYVELTTENTNAVELDLEYWDGDSWETLEIVDETLGLTRSGFLFWDRDNLASTTVNSVEGYFVRLKPDSDTSAMVVRGINIVFSDDSMLAHEFEEINNTNLLAPGASSHILKHISARNEIMQKLRNQGYIKYNTDTGYENITPWDLLDVHEIKQASSYLTLSKIFFNLSDGEDNWRMKYLDYEHKAQEMLALYTLTLDLDDDGVRDSDEKLVPNTRRWVR